MEMGKEESLGGEMKVPKLNPKELLNKIKLFIEKNKILTFIGLGAIALILISTGTVIYMVNSWDEKTDLAPIAYETLTSPPVPTPTDILILTPIPPTATPTPTTGPTPTPTQEPVDQTKGAIRIKLRDYSSQQPLNDVSSVNTTIKNGDFSSTKSGAEVYFYNLTLGQTYEVYVDNPPGYTHKASICGSDCQLFGGQQCIRKLPAKIPIENQEIECLYSKN